MTVLVADVGGTNTRLALIGAPELSADPVRFENDSFDSFYDVLTHYLQDRALPPLDGCCVAIAGPVVSDRARLTNRDWDFDARTIAATLPHLPARPVRLINDLAALGHALPDLRPDQMFLLSSHEDLADDPQGDTPARTGPQNGQSLVAGLGTGFNVCVLKNAAGGTAVFEAELGHASLPSSVQAVLADAIGTKAAQTLDSNEAVFSGPGLTRLHQIMTGELQDGRAIMAACGAGNGSRAEATVDLLARALGEFARQLVFQYMPLGGLHFAGSVARGILSSPARASFLSAFGVSGRFHDQTLNVPLRLITDDAAALVGAACFAMESEVAQGAIG